MLALSIMSKDCCNCSICWENNAWLAPRSLPPQEREKKKALPRCYYWNFYFPQGLYRSFFSQVPLWPSMKWAVMIISLLPSESSLYQVTCTTFCSPSTWYWQGSLVWVSVTERRVVTALAGSTNPPPTRMAEEGRETCGFNQWKIRHIWRVWFWIRKHSISLAFVHFED